MTITDYYYHLTQSNQAREIASRIRPDLTQLQPMTMSETAVINTHISYHIKILYTQVYITALELVAMP